MMPMNSNGAQRRLSKWMPTGAEIIVSLVCALCFAMAFRYIVDGNCPPSWRLALDAVILWVAFLAAFVIGRRILGGRLQCGEMPNALRRLCRALTDSRHPLILTTAVIVLFWSPVVVLTYPGMICYDTVHMLVMYSTGIGGGYITAHHPVFDTMLFGAIIVSVAKLTGSWQLGAFAYTALQVVGTAAAFSYALRYAHKVLKASDARFLVTLAFLCLFPLFPIFATYMSKDSLFSAFFVLFMVEFAELVRTRGACLSGAGAIARFIMVCLLCCLTKKLGMYIVIGSLFIVVIAIRRSMLKTLVCTLVVAVLMVGVYPAAVSATGIAPGGKQEALSVLFQQTARYVRHHPDDVTPQEREAIDNLLGYDTLSDRYQFDSADPVKGYQELAKKPDRVYLEYLRAWLAQGLRHPMTYFHAAAALDARWFSFERIEPLFAWEWNPVFDGLGVDPSVASRPALTARTTELVSRCYYFVSGIPVVNILFAMGFWATLLPAFALSTLLQKRCRGHRLLFVPVALSIMLGMWLSPTPTGPGNGIRYLIPVIYSMPFVLSWCRFAMTDDKEQPSLRAKHAKDAPRASGVNREKQGRPSVSAR